MQQESTEYATYNVLARKALYAGIPMKTLIVMLCLMLLSLVIGYVLGAGLKSIIVPSLLLVVLFVIRINCSNDSRAMENFWWDVKATLSRFRCQSSIASFTSTDTSLKKRRNLVYEWFKNHTD